MFLTESDFNKMPFNIPQSDDRPNALSDVIDFYEEEALKRVLGSALYSEFIAGVFVDPAASPLVAKEDADIEEKWLLLRDGGEYTYREKTYRYDGVKNFLKPYVFQAVVTDDAQTLTPIGAVQVDTENGSVVSPGQQIMRAYRIFSQAVGDCHLYKDTLWGFLSANKLEYPNWNFKSPGSRNVLSI